MKFCSQCGAANEADMTYCYSCGAPLEPDNANTGTRRGLSIPRPVLLIGCLVLVAALIIGGIFWFLSRRETGLDSALDNTMRAFAGKDEPTQFRRFFAVARERLEDGEYTMYADFSGGAMDFGMDVDYSRGREQLQGRMHLGRLELAYSAHKNDIQVCFPGEDTVYGFDIDDINRITGMVNDILDLPFVGTLIPVRLPTQLGTELFAEKETGALLEGIAGAELERFRESVSIKEAGEETILRDGLRETCRVYQITWDSQALKELIRAVGSFGFLPNVGGLMDSLLPDLGSYLICYINPDDYLVGARFEVSGADCFFLLEGRENLWDRFSLTAETPAGAIRALTGGMERRGEVIRLHLDDEAGQSVIALDYDDASGDFALSTATAGTLVTGTVTGTASQAGILLNWNTPEGGRQALSWSITELRSKPQQLGNNPLNLMNMAWMVLERIVREWVAQ